MVSQLIVLIGAGLITACRNERAKDAFWPEYAAVELPGTRSNDIADMLENITVDPVATDMAVIKKRIAAIAAPAEKEKEPHDTKRPTPDAPRATNPHPMWKNIAVMYRYLTREGAPVSAAKASSDFGVDNIAAVEGVLAALIKTGLANRYTKSKGEDLPEPLYLAVKLSGTQTGKIAEMLENITSAPSKTNMTGVKERIRNMT